MLTIFLVYSFWLFEKFLAFLLFYVIMIIQKEDDAMDPIAIHIGGFQLYWYSILMFLAFLCGVIVAFREAKRVGIKEDFLVDLIFYLVPISIVGARLYFVLFNFADYQSNLLDIFKIWEGGLAIHGGIIAGVLWIIYYCHRKNVSILKVTDLLVPALILGQAIGRWGNFFNGEAHGGIVSLQYLQGLGLPDFIIHGMYINGSYYFPTFLYESVWCLIGFVLLLILRRRKKIKLGQLTCIYMVWYSMERFIIEGMRTDSLMLGPLRIAQVVSILFFVIGVFGIFYFQFRKRKELYNKKEEIE